MRKFNHKLYLICVSLIVISYLAYNYYSRPSFLALAISISLLILVIGCVRLFYKNEIQQSHVKLFKDIFSHLPDPNFIYSLKKQEILFKNNMLKSSDINEERAIEIIKEKFPEVITSNANLSNKELDFENYDKKASPYLFSIKNLNQRDLLIISFKCIRELKEKDAYIKEQNENLIESSRFTALGEMASGFAHEINNPLTVILGNLSIMKLQIERNKVDLDRFVLAINKSTQNIDRIVKTIKSLQKLASSKNDKDLCKVTEISETITSHLDLLQSEFKTYFEINIDNHAKEESLSLYINLSQISQSIGHILRNAVEACLKNDKKWIQVVIRSEDSGLNIYITDSGEGIHLGIKDKIFNPMYTTKIEEKGSGLGLCLSKSFITHNLGKIELLEDATHTTFKISIPFHTEYIHSVA